MAVASNPATRYWFLFCFFLLFLVGDLPLDAPSFQIKGACLCLALTALNRPIKLLNNFFYRFCSVISHHIHFISFLSRALRCFCMSFCFGAFELGIILSRFLSQAVPLSDLPFCFGEASYHTRHINVFFFYWLISCQHVIRRKRCPDLNINGTVYTLHVYLNNWTLQYSFHRCKRNLLSILSPKVELFAIFLFLTELSVVLVCLCCLRLLCYTLN